MQLLFSILWKQIQSVFRVTSLQCFNFKVCDQSVFLYPEFKYWTFSILLFWFWRDTFLKLAVYPSPVKRITLSCRFSLFLNNLYHQQLYFILSPDSIIRKAVLVKIFNYLLIYLHSIRSKMVGKPTAYRTSRNKSIMHAENLQRSIKMNTLLQNYMKVR
jgi:hypothetical protein